MARQEHIVILGGGFAGRYTAQHLAPRLASGHRLTLIDRVDHMLYTPMLTEVAGGTVPSEAIAVTTRGLPGRVLCVKAEIVSVDIPSRTVTLGDGTRIQATHLVLALGATTSYHKIEGARENSLPLKTLEDAINAAQRVEAMATSAANPALSSTERNACLPSSLPAAATPGLKPWPRSMLDFAALC